MKNHPKYTPILSAAASGQNDDIDLLIANYVTSLDETLNIDKTYLNDGVETVVPFKLSPFLIAAAHGQVDTLKHLVTLYDINLIATHHHIDMAILFARKSPNPQATEAYLMKLRTEYMLDIESRKNKLEHTLSDTTILMVPRTRQYLSQYAQKLTSKIDALKSHEALLFQKNTLKRTVSEANLGDSDEINPKKQQLEPTSRKRSGDELYAPLSKRTLHIR
jgi:hypothetical protein